MVECYWRGGVTASNSRAGVMLAGAVGFLLLLIVSGESSLQALSERLSGRAGHEGFSSVCPCLFVCVPVSARFLPLYVYVTELLSDRWNGRQGQFDRPVLLYLTDFGT